MQLQARHVLLFCILQGYMPSIAQLDSTSLAGQRDSIRMSLEMHPVLLIADRNIRPQAVSHISAKALTSLQEPIIEPVLNSTPGIWMQSGALNTNRISIRGVGYREPFATTGIKVYLDEIPLTNGAGEASFEDIHPGLLSGIEIIRGPGSAMWGAGLGGMILLKTEMAKDDSWGGGVQAGAFGRLQADQSVGLQYGDQGQWATKLHVQYLHDDGFRDNNQYDRTSLTWKQHWSGTAGWSVGSLVHAIDLKGYIPSALSYDDYLTNPQRAAASWAAVRGNEDYVKLITGMTAGYTGQRGFIYRGSVFGTWFSSDEVRPFNVLDERSDTYGTRQRVSWQFNQIGHVSAGLEYYRERYTPETYETLSGGGRGEQLTASQEKRSYLHGFAQTELSIKKRIHLSAGLSTSVGRLEGPQFEADVPADVFPTIGMRIETTDWLDLTANVSRGYAALSLDDFINTDGSLAALVPETGWSREVSMVIGSGEVLSARITGYAMRIENTIVLRYLGDDQYEKYNGGKTRHRGVEAEMSLSDESEMIAWSAALTYQGHVFEEFHDGGIEYAGNSLPGIPRHRLFQTLTLNPVSGLSVSLSHHWVSEVFLTDMNNRMAEGYQLLNGTVAYVFQATSRLQLRCDGHVHNLLNTHYAPMFQINAPGTVPRYFYPGKPRSVYVRATFTYALGVKQ